MPNSKGNRSSPLYAICLNWINGLQFVGFDSNCSFTDVTVKSNRTGNIPRQGSGLSCRLSQPEAGSLTRFTASIIKHLMLHRKGDLTRQFSVGVFGVSLHLLARFYFSCPKAATIGFEPMIPVRCRMLDPFITLAAGFQVNP